MTFEGGLSDLQLGNNLTSSNLQAPTIGTAFARPIAVKKKTSESKKRSTGGKSVRIGNSMNAEFGIQILEPDHCLVGTVAAGVTKLWRISKKRLIQIEWPAQDFKPWEHTLLPHSQATPREVHGCKMCKTSVSYWHAGPFRRRDSTIFCETRSCTQLIWCINKIFISYVCKKLIKQCVYKYENK